MELLNDFNTSVEKAFDEIDPNWRKYDGLVICGTHAPTNVEETLEKIKEYRTQTRPILGICMGLQMIAIEFARNELGIQKATSEEWAEKHALPIELIVKKLPELRVGTRTVAWQVNGATLESHWHNYAVASEYAMRMSERGYKVVLTDGILEYAHRRLIIGCQFHPEYQSSKDQPHSLLVNFLDICSQK